MEGIDTLIKEYLTHSVESNPYVKTLPCTYILSVGQGGGNQRMILLSPKQNLGRVDPNVLSILKKMGLNQL